MRGSYPWWASSSPAGAGRTTSSRPAAATLVYVVSGRLHVAQNGGADTDVGPGAVATIAPGSDAWVVGEDACVAIDFGGYAHHS